MAFQYVPTDPPVTLDSEAADWLKQELIRISSAFEEARVRNIDKSYSAPERPREGDIVLADGVRWNPGNGAGFYGYRDGAWRFLG